MSNSIQKLNLIHFPISIISLFCSNLKIKDINRLASTCKALYQAIFINIIIQQNNTQINNKSVKELLYWKVNVLQNRIFNSGLCKLKMIKFIFFTKDQGSRDCICSTSSIQADFFKKNQNSSDQILYKNEDSQGHYPLIKNYDEISYNNKVYYLSDQVILMNLTKIQLYLCSIYPKSIISCKKTQIKFVYCSEQIQVKDKQLKQYRGTNRKKSLIPI